MKNLKFWLSTLSFVFLFSATSFATNTEPVIEGEPISVPAQIQDLLENLDLSTLDEERQLLVDFMINSRAEIIVLSTNDKNLDSAIKSSLNYKKLKNHDLKINETYTLPITFKKA